MRKKNKTKNEKHKFCVSFKDVISFTVHFFVSSVYLKFDADERKWKCNGSRLQIPIIKEKSLIKNVNHCFFCCFG